MNVCDHSGPCASHLTPASRAHIDLTPSALQAGLELARVVREKDVRGFRVCGERNGEYWMNRELFTQHGFQFRIWHDVPDSFTVSADQQGASGRELGPIELYELSATFHALAVSLQHAPTQRKAATA